MKRMISLLLTLALFMTMSVPAFAVDTTETDEDSLLIDLNALDLSESIRIEKTIFDENGNEVTIGLSYTPEEPQVQPYWSKDYEATESTWTAYYNGFIINNMSYEFDVSKSGSHWKISNARNLTASHILATIENKSLTINRAISTPSYPAEVMGMCTVNLIETEIGTLRTWDAWIKSEITDDGVLTISGN